MKRTKAKVGSGRDPQAGADDAPAKARGFPVVGVGASAGGLEAFTNLLHHLPMDTGMAFVLIQHLDPNHESALVDLLSRATQLSVREATNNLAIEPNHAYVIPPGASMTLQGGRLRLTPRSETGGAARCIDCFLESLAQDRHDLAIGVVLSGTASDGTLGLEAVKAEGGITFAQDATAKYDSMPRSAIASGCVDFVLSPEGIARELTRIARHPCVQGASDRPLPLPSAAEHADAFPAIREEATEPRLAQERDLKKILLLLRKHSGVDFSLYRPTTIQRRIQRRMLLSKAETLEGYAGALRDNSVELDALYSDLLISVTTFFRNPEAFRVLKRKVFPRLLKVPSEEPIRFWVLGCSTGQEAYSLGMACLESLETLAPSRKLQIFATDLNEAVLEKARQGLYAGSLVQDVSPERLRRFFVEEEGGYRIRKFLRELCVFARQNFLSDPPFSRMDLISCRNLLIYIEPAAQRKILPAFHYALKPDGCLFLGASESIGDFTSLFEPLDKKLKIFSRKPGSSPGLHLPVSRSHPAGRTDPASTGLPPGLAAPGLSARQEADRLSVARFAPPGVLVNAEFQVLQFRGTTSPYLQPPLGKPTNELLKIARPELMLSLRTALKQAQKLNRTVRTEGVRLDRQGTESWVSIEVIPLKNLKDTSYLVLFEDAAAQEHRPPAQTLPQPQLQPVSGQSESQRLAALRRSVAALEEELAATRDYLQALQEQHDASNEELQSSNEEVTSANEELQSINEELETSKEELESTNEELTTVNEEMVNRNQELNRLNSDLNNLYASINTPVLLLGSNLSIRHFTEQAATLFNLTHADVGRSLAGLKHNLDLPDLEKLAAEVVATVVPREREVQDKRGNWFVLRVRPYLSLDNKIDGALLVLTDINALKANERGLREARDYANAIIASVPPLLILDPHLRVQTANESFYQTFGVKPSETEGRLVFELGNGQWNIPSLRQLLESILPQNRVVHHYEVTHEFEGIGLRSMLLEACRVDHLQTIILSFSDITERKQAEVALQQAKEALHRHSAELEEVVDDRTAALRETVRELEAFSYSMVHDMRAPLRAMNGFARMLDEAYGNRLDATGRDYLARIFTAAERLDQLIRDVLTYTHVLRDHAPLSPIDLEQLLRELQTTYPDWSPPRAEVQIVGPFPTVLGHTALLAQCFSNLVSNAIRFVAPGVRPSVRVWAQPCEANVRISVQDNGIGIPAERRGRVFGMFQRIHPASDYEGTGIGLAIVRRAVERMGGRVGFDSEPGKGSTFWVDLSRPEGNLTAAP